jgi:pimeloyl-ACP methyl ester carboxylesterase
MAKKTPIKDELPWLLACIAPGIIGLTAYAASKFTPGKLMVILTGIGFLGFIVGLIILAVKLRNIWQIAAAMGISLLSVIVATYIILFMFVGFFQDAVANRTSSFFQPRRITSQQAQALAAPDLEELDLTALDGVHLRGWLLKNKTAEKSPLVIFFNGSGSESSEIIPLMRELQGWSVALINYRGFGLSEGTPTQANVLSDALFIFDNLSNRADVDTSRIVAMGYSLGTGVAVDLSARRTVLATILVSPYDHWSLTGVKESPFFAPLRTIMKPYFNSIALAPKITQPLLCLVGANDITVPPALSQSLTKAWGGKVTLIEYPSEDHGLLFHQNKSWQDIQSFLDGSR